MPIFRNSWYANRPVEEYQAFLELAVAAMNRANIQGTTEQQAEQLRSVMAVIFPEAVTLVREAREGLQ